MVASYSDVSFYFSVLVKCQIGDGVGDSDKQLSGKFTKENCIKAVKEQYPTANGATMDAVCPIECSCWAEFGMESWSGSSYTSCMFIQGKQCIPGLTKRAKVIVSL